MISLSPSSASRWLACKASPGYIARNAHRLPKESSTYADEGGIAHDYAHVSLVLGWDEGLFDTDHAGMVPHVKFYYDYVQSKKQDNALMLVEQKVPLFYWEERRGVVDVALVSDKELRVIDLKYGVGVTVEAVKNVQLAIYARSILEKLENEGRAFDNDLPVVVEIVQPRTREGDPVKSWHTTVGELKGFCFDMRITAREILANPHDQPFAPGTSACRFCPAKGFCTAKARHDAAELPEDVQEFVFGGKLPDADTIPLERLALIKRNAGPFVKWLNEVGEYLHSLAVGGTAVPFHKLVHSQPHRKWVDEERALHLLAEALDVKDYLKTEIITPAQAERLFKQKRVSAELRSALSELIYRPEGAPTLVEDGDARESVESNPLSAFTNLDDPTSLLS